MKRLCSVCMVLTLAASLGRAQAGPPVKKVQPPPLLEEGSEGTVYRGRPLQDWIRYLASKGTISIPAEEVLGQLGPADKAAVPVLAAALADDHPRVLRAVLAALERMGPPAAAAVPALKPLLKKGRPQTAWAE